MKILLTLITMLVTLFCIGQERQSAYWLFGVTFAIDFNEPTLRVQQLPANLAFGNYDGGWATICDKNGNFLFGVHNNKIIDRNLSIMKGGRRLHNSRPLNSIGSFSSSYWLPMIVERKNGEYWVFHHTLNTCGPNTQKDYACPGTPNGSINRSIVNMNRESGFGEVIRPRQLIDTFSARQMGVAMHSNERDSWLITHGAMDNQFRLYAITDTGLSSTPVVSNIGPRYDKDSSQNNSFYSFSGTLVTSPNSELIALRTTYIQCSDSTVYLFKVNRSNGTVDYLFRLKLSACTFGISFSSDSKKLYCVTGQGYTTQLVSPIDSTYQYDLSILDSSIVNNSKKNIGFNSIFQASVSMLDLTGRIIFGNVSFNGFLTPKLGIIGNPNNQSSLVAHNPFFYTTSTVTKFGSGLPILNQTQFRNTYKLQAIASKDTCCIGDTINVYGYGNQTTRFLWEPNPYLLSNAAGTVRAVPLQSTSFTVKGWNLSDSAVSRTSVIVVPKPLAPSITWNGRDSLYVVNPLTSTRYFWYRNDTLIRNTNLPKIKADSGHVYKVRAVGSGCLSDASNQVITALAGMVPIQSLVKYAPNPMHDYVQVQVVSEQPVQLMLYSTQGQLLYSAQHSAGSTVTLPTAHLPPGLYRLRVQSGKHFSVTGLVRE